jgi:hypothetical protein
LSPRPQRASSSSVYVRATAEPPPIVPAEPTALASSSDREDRDDLFSFPRLRRMRMSLPIFVRTLAEAGHQAAYSPEKQKREEGLKKKANQTTKNEAKKMAHYGWS